MVSNGFCFYGSRRGRFTALLCVSWIAGLMLGAAACCLAAGSFELRAAHLLRGHSSFSSLFLIILLPFIASAVASFLKSAGMLLFVAFAKAFLFAFVSQWLLLCMPDLGWLLRLLVMFSDIMCLPLLFLFIQQCLASALRISALALLIPASLAGLAATLDYMVISPLLLQLVIN